jgi:uracil-DNA glycosylase family 4
MKKDKIYLMYKTCSAEITSKTNEITQLLLGEGNFDAPIMFIAEAPSAKEEEYQQNILEDQRELLQRFLAPLGTTIDQVYITHLMKYRPYRFNSQGRIVSRAAQKEELDFFIPYLEKEIALINPKLIVTLGELPLQYLSKDFTQKVSTQDDQLLVVGILGKSYKLYPMHHPTSKNYGKSLERFLNLDVDRIRPLIGPAHTVPNEIVSTVPIKELETQPLSDTKKRVYQKIKAERPESLQNGSKNKNRYITVVYGGEGFVDDPVLIGIERIVKVLHELEVGVRRIDLYKGNVDMAKVFGFMAESKGVLLAINIEWFGIGHRMQQFLDECYFHGDVSYFQQKPLLALCFSRHGFEREAYQHLLKSWEILGGMEGSSILATIPSAAQLETNFDWLFGIDKKTESYYRIIQQEKGWLPLSKITGSITIETPVSSTESAYNSRGNITSHVIPKTGDNSSNRKMNGALIDDYDIFVEKQQQDIKEISSLIKRKLSTKVVSDDQSLPKLLKDAYKNTTEIKSTIQIIFEDLSKENTVIELNNQHIRAYYGQRQDVDVTISGTKEVLNRVFSGKLTMQRAFMTGDIKAKGEFTLLYKFEEYFKFN